MGVKELVGGASGGCIAVIAFSILSASTSPIVSSIILRDVLGGGVPNMDSKSRVQLSMSKDEELLNGATGDRTGGAPPKVGSMRGVAPEKVGRTSRRVGPTNASNPALPARVI